MFIRRKDEVTEPFRAPLGELIYEMIGHPGELGGTSNHSFAHVVLPLGKRSPAHYHKVAEETYYILVGRGRFILDGDERIVRPGDACLIRSGQVHQIFPCESDLEFITVSAPAFNPEDFYTVNSYE